MKSYPTLPQGYVPFATIDLVHNKKQFWIVNGLSVALCVIMLILPFLWGRSLRGFVGEGSLSALLLRLGALAGIFAYIALHELTHGAVMKACGASVRYGYNGLRLRRQRCLLYSPGLCCHCAGAGGGVGDRLCRAGRLPAPGMVPDGVAVAACEYRRGGGGFLLHLPHPARAP